MMVSNLAMNIVTNISSMRTRDSLTKTQGILGTSIERIASGLRINSARDDAAGQGIANRMQSKIRGMVVAERNAQDAMGLLHSVEKGVDQINELLLRMRDLAVQQRNGALTNGDRATIQDEITSLQQELDRVSNAASYGGTELMSRGRELNIQVSGDAGGTLPVSLRPVNVDSLELNAFTPPLGPPLSEVTITSGGNRGTWKLELQGVITAEGVTLGPGAAEAHYGLAPGAITIHQALNLDGSVRNGEFAVKIGSKYYHRGASAFVTDPTTGIATFRINNAFQKADIEDPDNGISLVSQPVDNVQLGWDKDGNFIQYLEWSGSTTRWLAGTDRLHNKFYISGPNKNTIELMEPDKIRQIDLAIKQIDDYRSYLGATQNRFESVISELNASRLDLTAAKSRIEDADYATEVTSMTRSQILQNAAQAVLAQANQIPAGIAQLIATR